MADSLQVLLENLADLTVQSLIDKIKDGTAETGHFAVARALLKDNNITAAALPNGALTRLGDIVLPTLPDDVFVKN